MISYTSNVENKTQAIYYSKKPKKSLYYTIEPNDDEISNSSEQKPNIKRVCERNPNAKCLTSMFLKKGVCE